MIAEIDSNLENCFYSEQAARLITISQVVFRDDENIRFPNNKQLRVLTLEEASGRINPKFLRRIGHMNHHQPPRHPCTLYLKKPVEITCDVVLHIVNLARKIETQLSGRSVLPSVAVNLAASGMDQYALNIALKMSDEEKRDDLLLRLVDIYIKKSKRYNAKFLIDYFGTQAKKDEALAKLSRYCLGLHPPRISSALKTANQILDPKLMAIAYLGISGELTKGRQYQAALEIALRITDPNCQDQAVESLFHAWAQGSLRVAEAICLVHTFINSSIAPSAHLGIADFYIASNRFNEAKEKLNEL
ncbi:MAG: hypothetical protein KDK65_02910, partial [Chlamydiia bacterium]|nr:hypothetical protein [Chlamydiia bacterium]